MARLACGKRFGARQRRLVAGSRGVSERCDDGSWQDPVASANAARTVRKMTMRGSTRTVVDSVWVRERGYPGGETKTHLHRTHRGDPADG